MNNILAWLLRAAVDDRGEITRREGWISLFLNRLLPSDEIMIDPSDLKKMRAGEYLFSPPPRLSRAVFFLSYHTFAFVSSFVGSSGN